MRRIKQTTTFVASTMFALATGLILFLAPAASAQTGYPPPPQPPVVPPTLAPSPPTRVAGGVAFTGANILRWALMALVLVAIGTFLVTVARRRRHMVAA